MVYIETSENALSVHEIAHVRQSKDVSGDGTLDFSSNGVLKNPGTREKKHLARYKKISDAEIEAYQIQFAFNPASLPKRATNVNAIDVHYVGLIINGKGQHAYPAIHEYSKYIKKTHKLNLPFP